MNKKGSNPQPPENMVRPTPPPKPKVQILNRVTRAKVWVGSEEE